MRKEATSGVVCGAIEFVLLTADDSWVADGSEVDAVFVEVVGTDEFVEDLGDPVDSYWLQDSVYWCIFFGEVFSSEDCNC